MNLGSRNKIRAEASMSSMTDLVFLMLIFFVILSTMISPGIPVKLPKSGSATTEGKSVSISVNADLQHFVSDKPVAVEQVADVVNEELKTMKEDGSILLRIDETVPTGVTVHLLDIAKQNHWKVAIATKNE